MGGEARVHLVYGEDYQEGVVGMKLKDCKWKTLQDTRIFLEELANMECYGDIAKVYGGIARKLLENYPSHEELFKSIGRSG